MAFTGGKKTYTIKDRGNARDIALYAVVEVCENSRKSHTLLKEMFAALEHGAANALSSTDRAFIENIVIGTLDRLVTLDAVIDSFSSRAVRRLKPVIRGILRISVYQILFMDRVPDSAACNEGVNLAKLHGFDSLSGYVNGVLRAVSRDREDGGAKTDTDGMSDVTKRHSVPEWLGRLITDEYGADTAEEIFKAWHIARRQSVRFNLSRAESLKSEGADAGNATENPGTGDIDAGDAEARILAILEADGYKLKRIDLEGMIRKAAAGGACGRAAGDVTDDAGSAPDAGDMSNPENSWAASLPDGALPVMYELESGGDVTRSEAFKKGYITIQDPTSALAVSYAAPGDKDFIIDVCSAPGGKALAAAELTGGGARIEARDVSERKTGLITENVTRCGYDDISVKVQDALSDDEDSYYRADLVIADLPCSGLGVVAKKPDIKINLRPYSIGELKSLQRDILTTVSRYVKPKGKLLYSTCTITGAENEENVTWMENVLGLKCIAQQKFLPGADHDGFFIAVMKKKY